MQKLNKAILAVSLATSTGLALADGPDFTTLTGAVALAGVVTGILAIAALKMAPVVAAWGARKVTSMMGR